MACGYMGMHVATHTNTKVSFIAQSSLDEAYKLAYRAGCVIGFSLTGISLLMLIILIAIYTELGIAPSKEELENIFENNIFSIVNFKHCTHKY